MANAYANRREQMFPRLTEAQQRTVVSTIAQFVQRNVGAAR